MQCPRRADRAVQFATLTAQGELDRAMADSGGCAKAMTGRRSPRGPLASHRSARKSPPPWRRDNTAGQHAGRAEGSFHEFSSSTFAIEHRKAVAKIRRLFKRERPLMRCVAAAFL